MYSWPAGFLVTGAANRVYYEAFGVEPDRLYLCTHSIDVARFAEPAEEYEWEAARWREQLGITRDKLVLLFAGKFEPKKRPLELMNAVGALDNCRPVLVMVGSGELDSEVRVLAAANPERFRVLPFQNQSRMPVVYRLGDLFVLPSAFGETWGLAVNEALACGRPVLVSDHVGCASDVVDGACGQIFSCADPEGLIHALRDLTKNRYKLSAMGRAAMDRARLFDITRTEAALITSIRQVFVQ